MSVSGKPFRYEEKSVEDDFELVNFVRGRKSSVPPSSSSSSSSSSVPLPFGSGSGLNNTIGSNYQQGNNNNNSGILSTATSRLSLSLNSPVMVDSYNIVDRNESIAGEEGRKPRRTLESVEYNFRPDFEKEYIKRTLEMMKREEEEEKTRKVKFITMLEEVNSKTTLNMEVIPQNNFTSTMPSLTQSINQLVNIHPSSSIDVNNNNRTPSPFGGNIKSSTEQNLNTNIPPSLSNDYRYSTSYTPPTNGVDSYQSQPTYSVIPTMNHPNNSAMLGFSTEEEVECYYNVLEVYKYPGFSTELARFATEAYRGEQLKVFDFCDKYRQLADMHFPDSDIKEVLLLTDRSLEQSLDMLVNQKSNSFPSHKAPTNKYSM